MLYEVITAFDEVEQHQHARPLIGVAPAAQNAVERRGQRQRLDGEQRAAGANGREPQFPGDAQREQPDQAQRGEDAYRTQGVEPRGVMLRLR